MNRKASKHKCVYIYNKDGKPYRWIVKTTIDRERKYLGCYKTETEAVRAYEKFIERLKQRTAQ